MIKQTMSGEKKIYLEVLGGLCNRLRAIASAHQVARANNASLHVLWKKNCTLNADFSDLFEAIENVQFIHAIPEELIIRKILGGNISRELQTHKQYHLISDFDNDYVAAFAKCIDFNNIDTWPLVIESSYTFSEHSDFSIFVPKHNIKQRIEEDLNPSVGVHIRYADNLRGIRSSPLDLFDNLMSKLSTTHTSVLLCTDDLPVSIFLQRKYSDILLLPRRSSSQVDRSNFDSIVDSVIELFRLSKAVQIYGTYWSTFGYTASIIGKCDYKVVAIDR